MSDNIIEIDGSNWEKEVIKSSVPVVVDFWASWCSPCKIITPILEEIVNGLNGKIKMAKVNVDEHMNIAKDNNIKSIPTLLFYVNGEKTTDKIIGSVRKETIMGVINKYVVKEKDNEE